MKDPAIEGAWDTLVTSDGVRCSCTCLLYAGVGGGESTIAGLAMTPREISRFETSLNVRNAWGLGLLEYIVGERDRKLGDPGRERFASAVFAGA